MILPGYTRPSRLKRFIRVLLGIDTDFDEYTFSIKRGSLRTILKTLSTQSAELDALRGEVERQENLAAVYRRAQLNAEEKLKREVCNSEGWKKRSQHLEATIAQLRDRVAGLRTQCQVLINLVIESGAVDDGIVTVFPELKGKNGQPALEFTKRARRVVNETRALLTQNEVG